MYGGRTFPLGTQHWERYCAPPHHPGPHKYVVRMATPSLSRSVCGTSIIIRSVTSLLSLLGGTSYFEGALACAKATKATTCPMEFPALEPQVPSTCACVYESGGGHLRATDRVRVVDPPEPLTTCEANGVFVDRDLRSSQTSLLPPLTAHHENLGHMIVS